MPSPLPVTRFSLVASIVVAVIWPVVFAIPLTETPGRIGLLVTLGISLCAILRMVWLNQKWIRMLAIGLWVIDVFSLLPFLPALVGSRLITLITGESDVEKVVPLSFFQAGSVTFLYACVMGTLAVGLGICLNYFRRSFPP